LVFLTIALVITIVTKIMAPIVIPNVVLPGRSNPGTGENCVIWVCLLGDAAAARLVHKKRMIKKTNT
jgi:hypothetical protein